MRRVFKLDLLMVAVIFLAVIVYGSLVPFDFHWRPGGPGPVRALLETWASSPRRSDFLANILFYSPFGFFACLSVRNECGFVRRVALVVFAGAILSIGMELAQYFDGRRFVAATDVYANVAGSFAGAGAGLVFSADSPWPFTRRIAAMPFPSLVLLAWLGDTLYPFVPAIDPHKYWDALKPVLLSPSVTSYDLFHYFVTWLVVYALLDAIGARSLRRGLFPLFALGVLAAKAIIVGRELSLAEILGAGAGYALWLVLANRPERVRAAFIAILLGAYVVNWRLGPADFIEPPRQFAWVPFSSVTRGSLTAHALSFFEKTFHYGALLWLLTGIGMRLWAGAIALALFLFATSFAGIYLPGRSPEISDAVLVLILAAIVALMTPTEVPGLLPPSALGRKGGRREGIDAG